ncbi:MAG: amidohydrolase [Gammaproteobacteria bacterium]|nr:amidohydrolase [Gammaproteobacteria bacterium]
MGFPQGAKVFDLMLGIPVSATNAEWYTPYLPLLLDRESRAVFKMPAQYIFRDIPVLPADSDYVDHTIAQMDRYHIVRAMAGYWEGSAGVTRAREVYPDRFIFDYHVNPNKGMDDVREIRRLKAAGHIHAVSFFPCGNNPQVPINDKKVYPIYATCVDLDLPVFVNVGVPGPRLPMAPQHTELVDEVCWFFPELKFVMRHGAEPWEDLAVKLMLKWPNLFYSTSAFAPKHYPRAIIDYANTRGADRIMYAGYWPMGLSLERIFRELPDVPFKDSVWPKFLYENAARLFGGQPL